MKPHFSKSIARTKVLKWQLGQKPGWQKDDLAREEPLEIRVRGKAVSITMRTPGHDFELAAGFLVSEGLVKKRMDILKIAWCPRSNHPGERNILNVFLAPSVKFDFENLSRHVFASSSCGICGKASIEAIQQHFPPIPSAPPPSPCNLTPHSSPLSPKSLLLLPTRLRAAQQAFQRTGGLHAAAIFDSQLKLVASREDVGRHNAVDKVIGYAFLKKLLPLDSHLLLVSGRASFEIMQKALAVRIPVVCAVSAPSSLAVEFARESGQTLVAFLRDKGMNIYSHPKRMTG